MLRRQMLSSPSDMHAHVQGDTQANLGHWPKSTVLSQVMSLGSSKVKVQRTLKYPVLPRL